MHVNGIGMSDPGVIRSNNEDYFHVDNDLHLYIVCDGVGGSNCGEVASQLAAQTCAQLIQNNKKIIDEYYRTNDERLITSLMEHAISESCLQVYTAGRKEIALSGMATTLTALLFFNQKAVLGHVGDSRCYLIRNNLSHQVTDDHTLGATLREQQKASNSQIIDQKLDHILNRCIGHHQHVEVDTLIFDILPGDQLVLCSDGLHNYIRDPVQLIPMLKEDSPTACVKKMLEFAIHSGGQDNVTAILIENSLEESAYMKFDSDKADLLNDFSFLAGIYLFQDLNFIRMSRLLNDCQTKEYRKGQSICRKGENPQGLFVFFSGHIQIEENPEKILTRGDYFGQQSLMYDYLLTFNVRAVEDSTILFISSKVYKKLCKNHPKFGVRLLENFIQGQKT